MPLLFISSFYYKRFCCYVAPAFLDAAGMIIISTKNHYIVYYYYRAFSMNATIFAIDIAPLASFWNTAISPFPATTMMHDFRRLLAFLPAFNNHGIANYAHHHHHAFRHYQPSKPPTFSSIASIKLQAALDASRDTPHARFQPRLSRRIAAHSYELQVRCHYSR